MKKALLLKKVLLFKKGAKYLSKKIDKKRLKERLRTIDREELKEKINNMDSQDVAYLLGLGVGIGAFSMMIVNSTNSETISQILFESI